MTGFSRMYIRVFFAHIHTFGMYMPAGISLREKNQYAKIHTFRRYEKGE